MVAMTGQQNKTPEAAAPGPGRWLAEGAEVVHRRFGTGIIARIGDYKGASTLWIDFDTGTRRALEIEFALPHLRPRGPRDATTPADPKERCDYCGGRPVVATVTGTETMRRCCDTHRGDLAKDLQP
jgi:hypothetical protein